MAPRTKREQDFLDDLGVEEHAIAKRWLDYEGGSMAVAALALSMHEVSTDLQSLRAEMVRHWWRTPAQFMGVAVAAALAALVSWKGAK